MITPAHLTFGASDLANLHMNPKGPWGPKSSSSSVSGIDQFLDQTLEVFNFKQWIDCILTKNLALALQRRRDSNSVFQVLSYLLKNFFPLTQGILNK